MTHVIERGVPIPPPTARYPFAEMEVGDSFATSAGRGAVSSAAVDYGKRHGRRFSVRQDGEKLRVWRVA